ncbi:UDP-N-acetylglucosamine transferase subunit ALG14 [Procambarus clarkii]|uniref:UDP-N-acetylglucosamine transferase subunit ALG14 n=1 Tax=Procambarus clarkii TaxID=6728 RepID=UPI001E678F81|nr:UDP-N-acetylglucosamine transferase subunit ALG14 homolog [Procambarus clarkii]XP_045583108.1 UDP-N-acetylglucosamine transferase subunit ALG14 homolog [Procambarus clarkii]XP_045583109.1 UDP-N-acetylglucosamine transferase subunit ALG14 homolog [Procambarus clarkii]XP_045583110.1 UDP-N-acetylglucosamine transferase subunit ALG14 homolog [Procambarus clarkii]
MLTLILLVGCTALLIRIGYVLYKINCCSHMPLIVAKKTVKTLVVLGSGGHTGEMLKMIAMLDPFCYRPRVYVVAATDAISFKRLSQTEEKLQVNDEGDDQFVVEVVPRTREVGQSWVSTAYSAMWALIFCILVVARHRPSLILTNGPGTCVPVCLSALLFRILGICQTRVVFIESLCRVQSLSLSGRILYRITDDFIVQWPQLKTKYPRSKYMGRLV